MFSPLAVVLKLTRILTDVHIQGEPRFLNTSGQAGWRRRDQCSNQAQYPLSTSPSCNLFSVLLLFLCFLRQSQSIGTDLSDPPASASLRLQTYTIFPFAIHWLVYFILDKMLWSAGQPEDGTGLWSSWLSFLNAEIPGVFHHFCCSMVLGTGLHDLCVLGKHSTLPMELHHSPHPICNFHEINVCSTTEATLQIQVHALCLISL